MAKIKGHITRRWSQSVTNNVTSGSAFRSPNTAKSSIQDENMKAWTSRVIRNKDMKKEEGYEI